MTRSDDRNNADCVPGDSSLREAINAANILPNTDAVNFAARLSRQTILLSSGSGRLNITGSLTIDASAAANLSVSGGAVSVFRISATVVMIGFRITGGRADFFRNGDSSNGGGILNNGDLTLNNMVLQGNYPSNSGGGIYSDNRLTINGGITSNGTAGSGGAIFGEVTVINLTNVTISGNQTTNSGGGGTNYTPGTRVTITNASITNNRSLPNVGDIINDGARRGNGGGIYTENAVLTMINSTISGNFGQTAGGGISSRGGAYNITGTTLSGNSTGTGSPGFGFFGGGALFACDGGQVTITNSTISGNRSNARDGNGGGFGGGGIATSSVINLRNVTIAYNRTIEGPGGGINTSGYPGTVNMGNTIVGNNSNVADNRQTYIYNPDVSSAFVSQGFNLVRTRGTSSGYIASDLPNGSNPLLERLASNGGTTQTHRLLNGSQAIDRGSNQLAVDLSNNTILTTDQRGTGFARIVDGNLDGTAIVDIGAFEVQTGAIPPPDLTVVKSHAGNFAQGQIGAQYTIIVSNNGGSPTSGTGTAADDLPARLTATAITGSGWTCTLQTRTCTRSDALASNSSYPVITLTVNVTNDAPGSVTNNATVSGGGETFTANNTANDATTVFSAANYTISGQVTNGGQGLFGVTVTLSGGTTRTTDAAGNYSFTNLAAGGNYTVTPSLSGYNFTPPSLTFSNLSANQSNANFATSAVSYEGDAATRPGGDGFINDLDSTAVAQIIDLLDAQPSNSSEFQRADAAPRITLGDGSVDVLDLVQTGRYFANLDPLTPAGGATTAQAATPSGAAATATVSAGSGSASNVSPAATVPIQLTSNGDVEAIQFSITYDQTKLTLPTNLATAFTNRYPNTTFTFNTAMPGRISVVAHQPLDGVSVFPAGNIPLFDINFTIVGTPTGTTSINFGNSPIPQRAANPNANLITVAATPGTIAFSGQNQIVNTLADHDDGACNAADCTLREAVKYAVAETTISFNGTGTITLTGGGIAIAKNLTISGPAGASGITVSGNNASRIFSIIGSSTVVEISALKLTGGNGVGRVGGGNGGAVYIESATVRLTNSTLSGNSVTGNGGAVRSNATLTVTNSTFSGNTAAVSGAIRAGGTLNITNSTISGNDAPSGVRRSNGRRANNLLINDPKRRGLLTFTDF